MEINNKFESILMEFESNILDRNDVLSSLNNTELNVFNLYLKNRISTFESKVPHLKKDKELNADFIEFSETILDNLKDLSLHIENQKEKPRHDIRKYIFTNLKIKLVMDRAEKNNDKYEIKIPANEGLINLFFNDKVFKPDSFFKNINVESLNEKEILFSSSSENFTNKNEFKKYMLSVVNENCLSWINTRKSNLIVNYIEDKILRNDIKFYALEEVFNKSKYCAPVINSSDGYDSDGKPKNYDEILVDAGGEYRFRVDANSDIATVFDSMVSVEKHLQSKNNKALKIK